MRLLEIVPGGARPEAVDALEHVLRPAPGQDGRSLQRHAGVHRQPPRRLLDRDGDRRGARPRPHGRGGRRRDGRAARHPPKRRLRAHGYRRPGPARAGERVVRPAARRPTIRGTACRRMPTCSGGWWRWAPPAGAPAAASTPATATRGLRSTSRRSSTGRVARPPRLPRTPRELVEMGGPARGLRRGGARPDARLRGGDGARGDRPARADRPGDAARLRVGARPVRADRRARRRPVGRARRARPRRPAVRIAGNDSASLWDTGDGVACLELHSHGERARRRRARDDRARGRDRRGESFRGLVITNDGPHFSVGANLAHVLGLANVAAWERLGEFGEAGRRGVRGAQVRAGAGGGRGRRAARSAAAASCSCTATRCRPTPTPTWVSWSSAPGSCPPGAAAASCCCAPRRLRPPPARCRPHGGRSR